MQENTLQQLRQELEQSLKDNQELAHSIATQGSLREQTSELSVADNHPADVATEVYERSKDLGLRDNALIQVEKITEALAKMEVGTYGKCDVCGGDIPQDRLEAIPQTTLCLNCKGKDELSNVSRARPIEEEALFPPFGRTFLDHTDNNAFDGEDSWQAVAQYGTAEGPQDVAEADDYTDTYVDNEEIIGAVQTVETIPVENDPDQPGFLHNSTRHGKRK